MSLKIKKTKKIANTVYSYLTTYTSKTPAFIRIIPTDSCNLSCSYCWQYDNNSHEMTLEEFYAHLNKAISMKVGVITFLGGEPMSWPFLYNAIAACNKNNIITDMTTNGTLLTAETIEKLGKAGLDYLNISVDGIEPDSITRKNSVMKRELLSHLKAAKKEYGLHFRINSVIYKGNFDNIKALIDFSYKENIQISLGYVVPPIYEDRDKYPNIYFNESDHNQLEHMISYIIQKKKAGYPIIDPESYFENIFKFLKREAFWDCNYPTRNGWINIGPTGHIRSCTKKMDKLDLHFSELDSDKYIALRKQLKEMVSQCNVDCYSNCAYDSAFYMNNKLEFMKKIIKRTKMKIQIKVKK